MTSKPPVRLNFDDGTRIMQSSLPKSSSSTSAAAKTTKTDTTNSTTSTSYSNHTTDDDCLFNPRKNIPIEIYYEVKRVSTEIVTTLNLQTKKKNNIKSSSTMNDDGFLCKVALQFPDELLQDASEVTWLIETEIMKMCTTTTSSSSSTNDEEQSSSSFVEDDADDPPLVFVLGDTTYSSCCPDEIGALHLNADIIVHYGRYACLSPTDSLPVIYSFGVEDWEDMRYCVDCISDHVVGRNVDIDNNNNNSATKLLVIYEVRYHHSIPKFASLLRDKLGSENVVIGHIPDGNKNMLYKTLETMKGDENQSCQNESSNLCQDTNSNCCNNNNCCNDNKMYSTHLQQSSSSETEKNYCNIGGLEISIDPSTLNEYTLLYIGDDSGQSSSRMFLNTILRCTSSNNGIVAFWSYNPLQRQLCFDPKSNINVSRYLNRRFYLIQKAKIASIIGILVGTLSQSRFRSVISSLRSMIEASGRSCYTFVVGKINIAKLANFAEVECFVLVACSEASVLEDERDFHIPIVTPLELEIALGASEWCGGDSCSTDFNDFLHGKDDQTRTKEIIDEQEDSCNDDGDHDSIQDDDDDEPFFSMISGTYVSKPNTINKQHVEINNDDEKELQNFPGSGQLTEYKSEAAEFWKKREYKGLDANIGKDEVKAAVMGQTGIASDYGK